MTAGTTRTIAFALLCASASAHANQTPVDQADASVVEEELREADRAPAPTPRQPILQVPRSSEASRSAIEEPVLVGAILVEGAEALPQAAFAPVVERYVGRTLSPEELRALASDIAAVARDAGYGLATAWIPGQRLESGVLRIRLDEGRIDAVEVTGSGRAAAEPRLRALAGGKPVRTAELERRLLLAGDVPGLRLGKARLQRRGGRNILAVTAVRDKVEGRASLDNWGSGTAGPVRARLSMDVNGVAGDDDRLSVDGVVTPFDPGEFALVRLGYASALGADGTELSVGGYYARSHAGGVLSALDIEGRSAEIGFELRHPLLRSRRSSLWASFAANLRTSSQDRQGATVRDDSLTTLAASLYAYQQLPSGRLRGRFTVTRGLALFGATEAGDPRASRFDGDGVFTKVELWGDYEQRLGRGLSVLLAAQAQLSEGPLLSSEEMGLGGRTFGRAWDYREFAGDRGVAGSAEVRYDLRRPDGDKLNAVQFYGYADAGTVSNEGTGTGGGSLASSGGGIRMWLDGRLQAGVEVGVPLTDGSRPTDKDKPRVSFTIDKRF
jgi:hemolysin activation/secretion protein